MNILFKLLNPPVALLLRSPLHGLLSHRIMLITVTGRRSGRRYTTPVSYTRSGETINCFTDREGQWWRNLGERPEVVVRVRGRDRQGRATVIQDVEAVAAGLGPFLKALPADAPVYGVSFDARREPNPDQVRAAAANVVHVQIALAG